MIANPNEITLLLQAWNDGDDSAFDKLAPLVYRELQRIARCKLTGERSGHSVQTGDLIHETFLRLIDWKDVHWENRDHLFGVAAQMMRRILIDRARARVCQKRGEGQTALPLEESAGITTVDRDPDLIAIDEALEELSRLDSRKSQVVELRFFGGFTVEESARLLGISPFTVIRDWNFAKAWLHRYIRRLSK